MNIFDPSFIGRLQFIFLSIELFIIFIFFVLSLKDIKIQFIKIRRKTWLILILILALNLFLSLNYSASYELGIEIDEWTYMGVGKNILLYQKTDSCIYGDNYNCLQSQLIVPPAYSFVVAISYFFFGINPYSTILVSLLSSLLSITTIFLISYLLFKNDKISLWSALFAGVHPTLMVFSTKPVNMTFSTFFVLFSILLFLLSYKKQSKKLIYLTIFVLAFAASTRYENFLLIPLILISSAFLFRFKKIFKLMGAWLVFTSLYIPVQLQILSSSNKYGIGSHLPHYEDFNQLISCLTFSNPYCTFFENLTWITSTFNNYLMIIFFIFFVIGFIVLWKKQKMNLFFLMLWVAIFSLIPFFYGSGHALRFLVPPMMPFLIISGNGAYWAIDKIKNKKCKLHFDKVFVILLCVFATFFLFNYDYSFYSETVEDDGELPKLWRLERENAIELNKKINHSCYMVNDGYNENFFNLYMDVNYVSEDPYNINKLLIEDKCVIYYVLNDHVWPPVPMNYNLIVLFSKDIADDYKIRLYKLSLRK